MPATLHIGQLLTPLKSPFEAPLEESFRYESRGGLLVEDGRIQALGPAEGLRAAHPRAEVVDHGQGLITPGFVDAHVHYPQTAIIASWGKRLIDWLETYTFPEEIRLSDPAYATEIAERYISLALAHGTTSMATYCTSDPASVTAIFEAADARNIAIVAGKTCMDRNAPEALCDTATRAYDESKALLETWHGTGRARYAITPRFSPTSTPEQLAALGALWSEHPSALVQTHISEQKEEIAWVQELFPQNRDYLSTYEDHGLIGPGTLLGHAIHLTASEEARIREAGATLIHCPTSNSFIGSGLFETARLAQAGQRIGLATDTGGGSSFSMLRTMAAAYEIGQLSGSALHPGELFYLATLGSAETLGLSHEIGSLAPGSMADFLVLDLASTPAIAQRADRSNDIWELLFSTIMMGDDRAITRVFVAGEDETA
ncbi:MAG: guanine deaminase [Pseudomonadota bacterium]